MAPKFNFEAAFKRQVFERKQHFFSWGPREEEFQMRLNNGTWVDGARLKKFQVETTDDKDAKAAAKNFISGKRRGLYLAGAAGLGKSLLSAAIWNEIFLAWQPMELWQSLPARFITEDDLFKELKSTFGRRPGEGDTEQNVLNSFIAVETLILDDLCTYSPVDVTYRNQIYFSLFDHRWASHKRLVVTTNLSEQALAETLGEKIVDRIGGICGKKVIVLSGESRR